MHAENYDRRLRKHRRDTLCCFDSAQVRHGYVDDRNIWLSCFGLLNRLPAIGRFRDYAEFRLTFQQQAQASTHHSVVVS
jgi:hypothetical protein